MPASASSVPATSFTCRLTPELAEKLGRVAGELGVSRLTVIRLALTYFDETTIPESVREHAHLLTFGKVAR